MFTGKTVTFEIIDIIRLKRKDVELNTINKSCYCLSCRLNGKSSFSYNENDLNVKTGDILYIPKNCSYSQKTYSEEVICFHLEVYGSPLKEFKLLESKFPKEICKLFDEAETVWKQKKDNYYYSCLSILYKILSLCDIDLSATPDAEAEKIKKSLNFLSSNIFNTQLSVERLYNLSNIGRTHFNEIFKKIYGSTPRRYIYCERINKAKMLLQTGNYTNEEIAYLCGFTDVKYFYVVFKKVTGKTTKEYKKETYL